MFEAEKVELIRTKKLSSEKKKINLRFNFLINIINETIPANLLEFV